MYKREKEKRVREERTWKKITQQITLFLLVSQIRASINVSQIALGQCQKRLLQKWCILPFISIV